MVDDSPQIPLDLMQHRAGDLRPFDFFPSGGRVAVTQIEPRIDGGDEHGAECERGEHFQEREAGSGNAARDLSRRESL